MNKLNVKVRGFKKNDEKGEGAKEVLPCTTDTIL